MVASSGAAVDARRGLWRCPAASTLATPMDRRSCPVVVVAALLLAAACGSSSPTPVPTDSASRETASPDTSASSAAQPSASPIAAGPAWMAIEAGIDADGKVSKETALQAFALAIGDLPGVTPPPEDPGTLHSGTMALRWLLSYWGQLTPEQQAAAVGYIPELDGLPRSAAAPAIARLAVARPGPAPGSSAPYAYRRTNAAYTALAKELFAEVTSHVKGSLVIQPMMIDAHAGTVVKSTSGMETAVLDANGGVGGSAAKCVIVVSPLGDAQSDIDARFEMAHEVFHCYEGAVV